MVDSSRGVRVCHGETWEQATGMGAGAESRRLILNCKDEAETELKLHIFNSQSSPHAPCFSSNKAEPPKPLHIPPPTGGHGFKCPCRGHLIQTATILTGELALYLNSRALSISSSGAWHILTLGVPGDQSLDCSLLSLRRKMSS